MARVFVAGGTGYMGREVIGRLLARGPGRDSGYRLGTGHNATVRTVELPCGLRVVLKRRPVGAA